MGQEFQQTCDLLFEQLPAITTTSFEVSPSEEQEVPFSTDLVVGSIGFGGSTIHGVLTLAGTPHVWASIAPGELGCPIPMPLLCDMVGELCNLMLGRFRNDLLKRGVEVSCATPTTIHGHASKLANRGGHSTCRAFRSTAGDVYVVFDVAFETTFSLSSANLIEPVLDELLLF